MTSRNWRRSAVMFVAHVVDDDGVISGKGEIMTEQQSVLLVGDRVMASFWGSVQVGIVVGIGRQGENDTYSILANGRRVTLERSRIKKVSPCQGYKDCALCHAPEQCGACNPELPNEVQP